MLTLKQQINSSLNFVPFFIVKTQNSSVNFKLIHFLLWTKDPIKVPILRLSSALVKICHVPVIFQTTRQSFFKFCITLQCRKRSLLCTFLTQTIYTLLKRSPSKCKFSDLPLLQFDVLVLLKVYYVWAIKLQRSYVSWHWIILQNLRRNWLVPRKMIWGIWRIFTQHLKV